MRALVRSFPRSQAVHWILAVALFAVGAPVASGQSCPGDCNGDGLVRVDELVTGLRIALETDAAGTCSSIDTDADGRVGIDEIVAAVGNALSGCPRRRGPVAVEDAARASTTAAAMLPKMYTFDFGSLGSIGSAADTETTLGESPQRGANGPVTTQQCGRGAADGFKDVLCTVAEGLATLETTFRDCRIDDGGGILTRNGTERITVAGTTCVDVPPADAEVTVELEQYRSTFEIGGTVARETIVDDILAERFVPDGSQCQSGGVTFSGGAVIIDGTQRLVCTPGVDPTCDESLRDVTLAASDFELRQSYSGPGCDRTVEANGELSVRNELQDERFAQTFLDFRQSESQAEDRLALAQNGSIRIDCLGVVQFLTRDDSRLETPFGESCPDRGSVEITLEGESPGSLPLTAEDLRGVALETEVFDGGAAAVSQTGGLFEYAFRAANGQVYQVIQNPSGNPDIGTRDVQITTLIGSLGFVLRCDGRDDRDQIAVAVVGTAGEPYPVDGIRVSQKVTGATLPCFNPNGENGDGLVCVGADCGADCRCPRGGCALQPFSFAGGVPFNAGLDAAITGTGATCRGELSTYALGTDQPTVENALCDAPPNDGLRLAPGETIVVAYDVPPTFEFSTGSGGFAIDTEGASQLCASPNTVVTGVANRNDLGRARVTFDRGAVKFDVNSDGQPERVLASCEQLSLARCGLPEPTATPSVVPLCPGSLDLSPPAVGSTASKANAVSGASCGDGGNAGADATYGFRAPTAGCYRVDTLDIDGLAAPFDTLLYVRRGADNCSGTELACNDNAQDTLQSELFVELAGGQEIVIVVDGTAGAMGDFRLNVARIGQSCEGVLPTPTPTDGGTVQPTATPTPTPTSMPTATRITNVWVSSGPDSGMITALVIDPASPQTLYAASFSGGVFKTSNGGASWNPAKTGLTTAPILALAMDPANSQIVYAGSFFGGAYKTVNGGTTWNPINSGLTNRVVNVLAVDPINSQIVYAGTPGGVFKSTNGGGTWSPSNSGLTDLSIRALAINFDNPEILYAGTGDGVFKSTDRGAGWNPSSDGVTNGSTWTLAIDPDSPQTLYVGTDGGVFKSTNGGAGWSPINNGLTTISIRALAIDPVSTATLYASAYGGGIFKTTNGGSSWNPVNSGLTNLRVGTLVVDPATPQTIYAGTGGAGVFKTTNGGGAWGPSSSGLRSGSILALAVDAMDPDRVYAGTESGVFKSQDGTTTWGQLQEGGLSDRVRALAIDPVNAHTAYAGTEGSGVFKKSNDDAGWIPANTGLTNVLVRALAIDPTNTQVVYAGTGGGVFRSTNGAATWDPMNDGLTNTVVRSLAISSSNTQTIYAGTDAGVFKTVSAGQNWNHASDGLTNGVVRAIAIDPVSPETVYAGTAGGVFKTTNGAQGWIPVNDGLSDVLVRGLAIDPGNPQTVYVASGNAGVFKSTNGGESWSPFNNGLDSLRLLSLVLDPTNPRTVYAGTADLGVFRIDQDP